MDEKEIETHQGNISRMSECLKNRRAVSTARMVRMVIMAVVAGVFLYSYVRSKR